MKGCETPGRTAGDQGSRVKGQYIDPGRIKGQGSKVHPGKRGILDRLNFAVRVGQCCCDRFAAFSSEVVVPKAARHHTERCGVKGQGSRVKGQYIDPGRIKGQGSRVHPGERGILDRLNLAVRVGQCCCDRLAAFKSKIVATKAARHQVVRLGIRGQGSRVNILTCLLYTSPSPRDVEESRMPSSA